MNANSFCPTNSFFKFPEDLERIFQPFQQATAPGLLNTKGTGLGLSLTRQLVELHGGKIWAESEGVRKGATFCLILPVESALLV